ncbi:hypothetical protein SEA_EJIMIX_224 [Mycobacterium phage Ejimix]|nr:hypothetical protein N860_gp184 [Mycobacterium phage Redno2]AXQ52222.1 hypothetical protein SEA_EJIMIX_224 [Mycobacterium phage Ejimix]AXQ52459.1 hypothetical protein SEA_ERICMILLARD_230 [Mycobacterium phage EricMillard]AXQ62630.1 hypothetical protein SEA_ZELINK_226 [Mycobacterium phage Zelink]QBI97676.1 hypothetical protein SEA_HUGHESYANG_235 [Mycobacterium phage Hughesyang]QBI99852.1 hypothetical protein SEA_THREERNGTARJAY_232 [Mycobacterium phage ThreeRngTarjay]QCO93913.1 hypothetical p
MSTNEEFATIVNASNPVERHGFRGLTYAILISVALWVLAALMWWLS